MSVNVYASVDVSGSMQGSKITEVCSSLQELVFGCPDDVLFDVTLFSRTAWKIVTSLRSSVNLPKLNRQIVEACNAGGNTALYDAWGDMLTSIPKSVLANCEVQIFLLTDGEDNASTRYNAVSVMQLTQEILKSGRVKFNFIQCGRGTNDGILRSLKQICPPGSTRMQSHVVENSAQGIKTAMASVRNDIMLSTRSGGGSARNATMMSTRSGGGSGNPSGTSSSRVPTVAGSNPMTLSTNSHAMLTTVRSRGGGTTSNVQSNVPVSQARQGSGREDPTISTTIKSSTSFQLK